MNIAIRSLKSLLASSLFNRIPIVLALSLLGLSACTVLHSSATRSWVDDQTAVSVTAQAYPTVFSHDDFPVGVNVRDYAELGAFEVNRSGQRHQYLCLIAWSTLNRTAAQQAQIEAAFDPLIVWADDQPLSFKRLTNNREMLSVSSPVFNRPTSQVSESYYQVTAAQLTALAAAHQLTIAPVTQVQGDEPYHIWQNEHASFIAFVDAVVSVNGLAQPATH